MDHYPLRSHNRPSLQPAWDSAPQSVTRTLADTTLQSLELQEGRAGSVCAYNPDWLWPWSFCVLKVPRLLGREKTGPCHSGSFQARVSHLGMEHGAELPSLDLARSAATFYQTYSAPLLILWMCPHRPDTHSSFCLEYSFFFLLPIGFVFPGMKSPF